MSASRKSQRTFMTVTMITVIAVTMVFIVYAALLTFYTGKNVVIGSMGGHVEYSLTKDPGSWDEIDISQGEGSEWYARIHLLSPPTQVVTVKWTLQMQSGGTWTNPTNVTQFTSPQISLTTTTFYVYAYDSGNNEITNNHNWGQHTTVAGTYRIVTEIYTT